MTSQASKKTIAKMEMIKMYLAENGASKASDIAQYIGLSPARTRVILGEMDEVQFQGENRNRVYNLRI